MSQTDTLEAPAGEQPQADSTTAENGGAEPQNPSPTKEPDLSNPEGITEALSQLPEDIFESLQTGGEGSEGSLDTPESQIQTETPKEEARGEQPVAKTEEVQKEVDEGQKAPDRIRLNGIPAEDRHKVTTAINAVKDGTFSNFAEAMGGLFGITQNSSSAAQGKEEEPGKPSQAESTPEVPEPVAAIDQEIADLKAKRTEARGEFDSEKADELTDEITMKIRERERVEEKIVKDGEADKAYMTEFETSKSSVLKAHPDLSNPESAFSQRFAELRDLTDFRAGKGDPEAIALLDNPRFLEDLAATTARDLGINNSTPKTVPPAPQGQVVPKGAVSSAAGGSTEMSSKAAIRALKDLSADDFDAIATQIS